MLGFQAIWVFVGVGGNRAGWHRHVHATVMSIWVWWVVAWLQDVVWCMFGVPARVFDGGGHVFGCHHWQWQHYCIATTGMGVMMTLSLSPSMACAVFLLAHVVSGRWQWQMPTWCLPVHCLYLSFPASCLLLFPYPFPPFPSTSLGCTSIWSFNWHLLLHKASGGGELVVPTGTGQLFHSGGVTPVGVAPQGVSYVVYEGAGVV